jgi:NAD(P)-dependent dehydrogenase (short-subunit alcohol dehydrogenase family)
VEKTGQRVVTCVADVRDRRALEIAAARGVEELGGLDIVLANAGIMPLMGESAKGVPAWTDAIDVMLTGVFHTIEVAIPYMIQRGEGGSIVITGSTAGLKGLSVSVSTATPGMLGYTAAKHGVVGLMRAYANSLASDRIRVNAVHPAGVNTPMVMNEAFGQWISGHPDLAASMQNPMPVELVEPEDVSNAVAWLCSSEARYVTGISLPVDAGFTNA